MAYATSSDYLAWTSTTTAPAGISRLLEVASARIDELLVGAVYDTDTNGAPTDADVAELFANVTCEQALYMRELGDTTGAREGLSEMQIGRMAWKRGRSMGTGPGDRYAERYSPNAASMLHSSSALPVFVSRIPLTTTAMGPS